MIYSNIYIFIVIKICSQSFNMAHLRNIIHVDNVEFFIQSVMKIRES